MKFTIYQESRPGKRPNNEDRIAHCYSRDALLMVVADGMGGHHHGEVASQIAAQTLTDHFQREALPRIADPFLFLQKGMQNAHLAILDYTQSHRLSDSPRTTCVAAVIQDNIAYWAHVGDSRLYLLRGGKAIMCTRDHSRVQLLLDEGLINEAQAAVHPERNKIYNCLGGPETPEVEFSRKTPLESGDILVLCTDGVWSSLNGDTMAAALLDANLMQAVPVLLTQAEIRGGPYGDNLSAVVVRWEASYFDDASSTVSTQTMRLDAITTRLEDFGRDPQNRTDLSEDEIEQAISEIRNTIEKYAKKIESTP